MKNLLYKYFALFTENINELGKAKSVQHLIRTTKLPNVMPMRRTTREITFDSKETNQRHVKK